MMILMMTSYNWLAKKWAKFGVSARRVGPLRVLVIVHIFNMVRFRLDVIDVVIYISINVFEFATLVLDCTFRALKPLRKQWCKKCSGQNRDKFQFLIKTMGTPLNALHSEIHSLLGFLAWSCFFRRNDFHVFDCRPLHVSYSLHNMYLFVVVKKSNAKLYLIFDRSTWYSRKSQQPSYNRTIMLWSFQFLVCYCSLKTIHLVGTSQIRCIKFTCICMVISWYHCVCTTMYIFKWQGFLHTLDIIFVEKYIYF